MRVWSEREMETINHYPAYLMFSPVLFRLGVLYERITSSGCSDRCAARSFVCSRSRAALLPLTRSGTMNDPVGVS